MKHHLNSVRHQSKIEFDRPENTMQPKTSETTNFADPNPDCIVRKIVSKLISRLKMLAFLINKKRHLSFQGQYKCNRCDVKLNSETQLEIHLNSLRHQANKLSD